MTKQALTSEEPHIRAERATGETISEMRANISEDLYKAGDAVLMWVNEGDWLMYNLLKDRQ
jgi:hypothetical protein